MVEESSSERVNMNEKQQVATGKLSLSMLIDISTPGAIFLSAIAPAVFGFILALETGVPISVPLLITLLLIPALFNASINLINDYFDYVRGNDTNENIFGETDSPLAFNQVKNPKPVFWIGLLCLLIGGLLGIYVIYKAGFVPLVIGIIGAIAVLTYSGGKYSVSHLPIGEPVAGFVMGGLIPLGVFTSLTGILDLIVLIKSIPMMLIVAQFMLVNNTCDIERDKIAGRRTLPIVLGRKKIHAVAAGFTALWVLSMLFSTIFWYPIAAPVILIMIFILRKRLITIYTGPRLSSTKIQDVWNMVVVATAIGIWYPIAVLIHILIIKLLSMQ